MSRRWTIVRWRVRRYVASAGVTALAWACMGGLAAAAYCSDKMVPPADEPAIPQLAGDVKERVEALAERLRAYRREGDFENAHAEARAIWQIHSAIQGPTWWETVEWGHLAGSLEQITRLPADDQCRLADSYARDERVSELLQRREFREAIGAMQQTLEDRRAILGADHLEIAHTLNRLGTVHVEASGFADAEASYRSAIDLYRNSFGVEHPCMAASLHGLAAAVLSWRREDDGVTAEVLTYLEEALSIYRAALGSSHKNVATTLRLVASCQRDQERFELAERNLRAALAILRSEAVGDDQSISLTLANLANLIEARGRKEEAMAMVREELELRQRKIGGGELSIARLQLTLALFHDRRGEHDMARPMYKGSLEALQRALPPDHIRIGLSRMSYGFFLHRVGRFVEAEEHLRAAVPILHARYGDHHWRCAMLLSRLAVSVADKGDYVEAERLFLEARNVYRHVADEHDRYRLANLSQLAHLYAGTGNYAAAEVLLRQVFTVTRNELGESHDRFAKASKGLAELLLRKGRFREAEEALKQAIDTFRRAYGPGDHTDVASASIVLAEALTARGDVEGAERTAREALRIFDATHDERHSSRLVYMGTLAGILIAAKKPAEAEVVARRTLRFAVDTYGGGHPAVARASLTLAEALEAGARFREAESTFREALRLARESMGDRHTATARALHRLARLLSRHGRYDAAEPLYYEALTIAEQKRSRIVGDERARAAYAGALDLKTLSNELAHLMIRIADSDAALTILERGRGRALLDLLTRADQDLAARLRDVGDAQRACELEKALQEEAEALSAMRVAEARLRVAHESARGRPSPADPVYEERAGAAVAARKAHGDAEAAVFVLLREAWPDARPLASGEVRAALRTGDLMAIFSETEDAVSLLLVPPLEQGEPVGTFVANDPSDVEKLRELVTIAVRGLASGRAPEGMEDPSASARVELFERLFPEPIRERILGCRRLIIVPDGVMRQIPMESLLVESGAAGTSRPALLLDARPAIVYADSATIYANRCQVGRSGRPLDRAPAASALVVGGPDFGRSGGGPDYPQLGLAVSSVESGGNADRADLRRGDVVTAYGGKVVARPTELVAAMDDGARESEPGGQETGPEIVVEFWRGGSVRRTLVDRGALGLKFTAGSPAAALAVQRTASRSVAEGAAEVDALDQVRLYGGDLPPLDGARHEAKALAELFAAAGGYADMLVGREATIANVEASAPRKRYVHFATHGIVGSEANPYHASLALTQPETLTPHDIGFLSLDHLVREWRGKLTACELVVLSACETTKGVETGDSIIALPWGFMYAGAPSVVASLWKVDDTATTLLMKRFYGNLLGQYSEQRGTFRAGNAMPKAEALREAKCWLRTVPRSAAAREKMRGGLATKAATTVSTDPDGTFADPYYWAAFVLLGDPN